MIKNGFTTQMKKSLHPNIKPWLWLAWLVIQQGLCAQDPGFRTPVIPPRKEIALTQADIVNEIVYNQQADKVAALADDDPLLAAVYLSEAGGLSTDFTFIERDMIRRGNVSKILLLKIFESPPTEWTRANMIHWIRDNPWIDPEAFLPSVRLWYQELKHDGDPHYFQHAIQDFLAFWGYPEDEVIMKEIAPDGLTMRLFRERLQRIGNGDNKSNPNLPPSLAYRNKTLDQLRASVQSQGTSSKSSSTPSSASPVAKNQPPAPQSVENSPAGSWLSRLVAGVLLAAAGLAAILVAKKRRN